jgi:hypothetical protein
VDEVDGYLDVDALLLQRLVRPVAVVELSTNYLDSAVAGPLGCLGVVGLFRQAAIRSALRAESGTHLYGSLPPP